MSLSPLNVLLNPPRVGWIVINNPPPADVGGTNGVSNYQVNLQFPASKFWLGNMATDGMNLILGLEPQTAVPSGVITSGTIPDGSIGLMTGFALCRNSAAMPRYPIITLCKPVSTIYLTWDGENHVTPRPFVIGYGSVEDLEVLIST